MERWRESRAARSKAGLDRKKRPQAIRLELCSISLDIAGVGPRDLTFEIGSDAWGLNPLGGSWAGLARHGESAAPC